MDDLHALMQVQLYIACMYCTVDIIIATVYGMDSSCRYCGPSRVDMYTGGGKPHSD